MAPILVAGMWQETNTYSSRYTTLADFEAFELVSGEAVLDLHRHQRSVIGGFLSVLGPAAVAGLSAAAWPGGLAPLDVFDALMSRYEEALRPFRGCVSAVLLNLHGAMVAEGHPDVELEVVRLTKRTLGDVPIVATVDFHANPSIAFLAEIDALTSYRTYPHIDMFERGAEAAHAALAIVRNNERWSVTARKLPLITSPLTQGSADRPVAGILDLRRELSASQPGLLSAMPGFAYSDVDRAGFTLASCGPVQGDVAVELLAAEVWATKDQFHVTTFSAADAVARALAEDAPTVLADIGDNIGGGSPGEGTTILGELLAAQARSGLAVVADSSAVEKATVAGVGARLQLDIGGRSDRIHGPRLSVVADVVSLSNGRYIASGNWMGGHTFDMGPTATVRVSGMTVILTTVATPPFHREQITSQGLDPSDFSVVVAKGALAWQDALADIADGAIFVDSPGSTPAYPQSLPREQSPAGAEQWVYPRILRR